MKKLVYAILKSAEEWLKKCAMNEATECETAENYIDLLVEII